ncbi:NIPSNAP family protein [Mucilaginibacter sp. JRF]|uniref:NIPSNAP family protein n=1 Tax=Mucilaginibacter sp. JRF TaxID=2780088 RepID=UPI001880CEF6|nr:NIPSNAP family protein [Mucilaginibacter sp. JRF]MBE9585891.1 NIPSNAP family protein [Mucilaginibacter sp. JRF]
MKRRSFVKASVMSTAAVVLPIAANATENTARLPQQEFYELRAYQLKDATQQKLVEDFYKDTAIAALNKLGVKHVGVFTQMQPETQTKLFVLIQYNSLDHFDKVAEKLSIDTDYFTKGATYLNAPAKSPAYERIETSLLKSFKQSPILEAPDKSTRLFELRQYQSPSEAAGKQKIEMFNDQGEMGIFKRLGFKPVFWGETVIGNARPNLTYMLTFADMDAKNAHWKAFGSDPEWKKISSVPKYADALLINKIVSTMLVPTEYSQI